MVLTGIVPHMACAGDVQRSPAFVHAIEGLSRGAVEFNLAAGYTHNFRRTEGHVTKLQGVPVIVGMGVVATGPIGDAWYRGQVTLGGEAGFIQYVEPLTTYLASVTPTVKYTFLASDRFVHMWRWGRDLYGPTWGIGFQRRVRNSISIFNRVSDSLTFSPRRRRST